jgi:hypothetical protein
MSSQDAPVGAFRTYLSTEWHQLANSWPIAFGAIISFGWAVFLLLARVGFTQSGALTVWASSLDPTTDSHAEGDSLTFCG